MRILPVVANFLAAVIWLIAGVPFLQNEFARLSTARDAARRGDASARVAAAAAQADDPELAVRAWTDAVAAVPERPDYRLALARAYAAQILAQESTITARNALRLQKALEDAVAGGEASDNVLLALGRLHMFRNQRDAARKRYDQVIAASPKNGRALMYLGDLQFKMDELDNAQTTLRRALEVDPGLTLAKFALGQVLSVQKKWEDAMPLLEAAAREAPGNAQVFLAYGRALAAQEQWPEAQKALERSLALEPGLAVAYGPLGDAYLNTRRLEAAIGAYRMAWEKSRDLESFRKIGRLYFQLGSLEAASAVFSQIRDLAPDEPEPHMILGIAAQAAKRPDVARPAWERCVQLAEGQERWVVVADKCRALLAQNGEAAGQPKKGKP